ncbi:hypothetical protein EIP86_006332 [Pleurotus ostreatoroseus]|nr:hypothetical protein EIP86_006332 [Pleurotus ostreatoroseus]
MASVAHLRAVILSTLNSPGSQDGNQHFFEELMSHKHNLLKLSNVGPRSPQEQRELESGRILVDGKPLAVNADFAKQTVFISQQLDVSERYVAGLLQDVMAANPNLSQEQLIEATVLEFHLRRRQLAECLRYIFEAAEFSESEDAPQLYEQLHGFITGQILAGGDRFPRRLFTEIDKLEDVISRVQVERQNARSNTAAPSQQGDIDAILGGQLGLDVLNARYDSLRYERRTLATVLYLLGRMGYIAPDDIQVMISWLQKHPSHPMTYYLLPTILTCFDVVDPETLGGETRHKIATDAALISSLKSLFGPTTDWKDSGLKSVLLLKWTLFLTEARHRQPDLEDREGFKTDDLETQVWSAVQGGCFLYATRTVMTLNRKQGAYPPTSYAAPLLRNYESDPALEIPTEDFKPAILESFEVLVQLLITHASSELRKIKQRQEDILLANARTDRTRAFRSSVTQGRHTTASTEAAPSEPARNDIAMLFVLIGALYSALPPDSALPFWGGGAREGQRQTYISLESAAARLPSFLQWAVWSTQARDVDMLMALYDMLTGLAHGQQCSELAYNFLARGSADGTPGQSSTALGSGPAVSWGSIFALLEQWALLGSSPRPPQQSSLGTQANLSALQQQQTHRTHHHQPLILTQQDVLLAQSFLRLLAAVSTHSVAVRITISGHARFRAIPTMVSLIPLSIPLELKGALFDVLASFCLPGAGAPGVEICKSIWTMMERLELINVRAAPGSGVAMPPIKGIEVELEEVEAVHKLYPETIPFLRLLSTLMHTPKSVPSGDILTDSAPLNTIPDTLGHPYRQPGIAPYTSFVVDKVFSRISQREYLKPSDRWLMNDLCLCFIERCLASFDLESLVTSPDDQGTKPETLLRLAVHPGYDVMRRMLTQSSLQTSILSYLVDGLDGFEKGLPEDEPFFRSTIVRVLRIIHRVLDIQDIFLDVFILYLSALGDNPVVGEVQPVSYYIRLDQSLLYGSDYVSAIAAYVSYPLYHELMLLSVKILSALASPSSVTQLAAILDKSADSVRILDGFQKVMDSESLVDVELAEHVAEESTGAGAPDVEGNSDALTQAIRVAILDFFIQNTQPNRAYPNVAHLLLFGKAAADNQIQDPAALGARRACIHSIIDMVNLGVPRLKSKGKRRQHGAAGVQAFMITLPGLAERCYQVIYQLCKHPRTSEFSMRYLRSREEFFTRHLAALPFKIPPALSSPYIEVRFNDASRVITTVSSLRAFLRLRSVIFDLTALELHVLTTKNHLKSVFELLELLYGSEETFFDEDPAQWEDDIFRPFHEVGQSHIRMIEFLQSLDFDWSDSVAVEPVALDFFSQLNLNSCLRQDGSGCEVVDKAALLGLIAAARRSLHAQGRILTPAHAEQLVAETSYILESCVVENHRREVQFAVADCFESWRRLLDMTLMKCFDRIPQQRREGLLFDLLHALPSTLLSANTQEGTAAILAEAILSALTKLREDRRHMLHVRTPAYEGESGSLPAERLLSLLRSLLDCVLDSNHNELVRGNLYASLVNYVHLITDTEDLSSDVDASSLAQSVSRWAITEDAMTDSTALVPGAQAHQATKSLLVSGSVQILKPGMERLVSLVSRDAIDGAEVWKTVAFVLLDSLVRLSLTEKQPFVFAALSRPGFIAGFVQGLKESDVRLQGVLKPDPDDLNPLYVYEAKMSLLIRMAQTRAGAERLLESRLIPVLADCDFLDTRPEADEAFIDRDSFLPPAIQRYHQMFLPALRAVSGMLAILGTRHASATNQAAEFLKSHRDTVILLLKNEADELSLSSIDEMRLLVSLSTTVLPLIQKSELLSSSGFGGIHAAIMHLAAKALGNSHWSDAIRPSTDEELTDASVQVPAYGQTQFRVNLNRKEMHLRKSIVIYLGAASNFTGMSSITTKQDEGASRYLAVAPSVGDAIDALGYVHEGLSHTLRQFLDFSAELASKDHAIENIPEIFNIPDTEAFENLDVAQRQALINNELQNWQKDARARAHVLFQLLEMLLLLIWRHLGVYGAEDGQVDIQNLNRSMRIAPSFNVGTFRADAGRKLGPVLHRMTAMAQETHGLGWQSYEKYMEIMARRLRDTAGLHDALTEEDEATESS